MNKEKFYKELLQGLNFKYETHEVNQPNGEYDLLVKKVGNTCEEYHDVSVSGAYTRYLNGESVEKLQNELVKALQEGVIQVEPNLMNGDAARNFSNIKKRIIIVPADKGMGGELYKLWTIGDLQFTYAYDVTTANDFAMYKILTKDVAAGYGVSLNDIYSVACENAEKVLSASVSVGSFESKKFEPFQTMRVQLIRLLDTRNKTAVIKIKPEFLSASLLAMNSTIQKIAVSVGSDLCLVPLYNGVIMLAATSKKNIASNRFWLAAAFTEIFETFNQSALKMTEKFYCYDMDDGAVTIY